MALNDSYGTKAALKLRLGVGDTIDDAKLDSALSSASQSIEGTCGRQFNDAGVASARVFYPDSPTMVKVEDFSTSVGLVLKADYGNDGVFETTWLAANYQLEPLNRIVRWSSTLPLHPHPRHQPILPALVGRDRLPASIARSYRALGLDISFRPASPKLA